MKDESEVKRQNAKKQQAKTWSVCLLPSSYRLRAYCLFHPSAFILHLWATLLA